MSYFRAKDKETMGTLAKRRDELLEDDSINKIEVLMEYQTELENLVYNSKSSKFDNLNDITIPVNDFTEELAYFANLEKQRKNPENECLKICKINELTKINIKNKNLDFIKIYKKDNKLSIEF